MYLAEPNRSLHMKLVKELYDQILDPWHTSKDRIEDFEQTEGGGFVDTVVDSTGPLRPEFNKSSAEVEEAIEIPFPRGKTYDGNLLPLRRVDVVTAALWKFGGKLLQIKEL